MSLTWRTSEVDDGMRMDSGAQRIGGRKPAPDGRDTGPETIVPRPGDRPVLVVVVDTEEEFDWGRPFDPAATSVSAIERLYRGQEVCEELGVRPCYVVDHPVASSPRASAIVGDLVATGRAVVGAHLHPWVSPPVEEEICRRNSFAGNLPRALEAEKLARLTDEIERGIGERPVVYKAGRYGFGAHTASILEEQGYAVDLSFCPAFDFSDEGGPDYSSVGCHPFRFGRAGRLLGLPATGAYVGFWRWSPHRVHDLARGALGRRLRIEGIMSRLGAIERLHLSPEGHGFAELRRLTTALLGRGVRVFTLSYHSPSLEPGCTPYVRSEADLQGLLGTLRAYLRYFLSDLGGETATPLELKQRLESALRSRSAGSPNGSTAG